MNKIFALIAKKRPTFINTLSLIISGAWISFATAGQLNISFQNNPFENGWKVHGGSTANQKLHSSDGNYQLQMKAGDQESTLYIQLPEQPENTRMSLSWQWRRLSLTNGQQLKSNSSENLTVSIGVWFSMPMLQLPSDQWINKAFGNLAKHPVPEYCLHYSWQGIQPIQFSIEKQHEKALRDNHDMANIWYYEQRDIDTDFKSAMEMSSVPSKRFLTVTIASDTPLSSKSIVEIKQLKVQFK